MRIPALAVAAALCAISVAGCSQALATHTPGVPSPVAPGSTADGADGLEPALPYVADGVDAHVDDPVTTAAACIALTISISAKSALTAVGHPVGGSDPGTVAQETYPTHRQLANRIHALGENFSGMAADTLSRQQRTTGKPRSPS